MNQCVGGWGTKEGRIHCQSGYEWVLNTAWVRGRNSSLVLVGLYAEMFTFCVWLCSSGLEQS